MAIWNRHWRNPFIDEGRVDIPVSKIEYKDLWENSKVKRPAVKLYLMGDGENGMSTTSLVREWGPKSVEKT